LLQLAFNCSDPQTAAAAVGHLPVTAAATARDIPELLEPEAPRRWLLTAATRQHTAAVEQMVQLGYLRQLVDATVLEAMLRRLLMHHNSVDCSTALLRLPAAKQLSSNAVLQLLYIAVTDKELAGGYFTHLMCQLPGAQQLDRQAVLQLLQAAVQHDSEVSYLMQLPAAQLIDGEAVMQLLHSAMRLGSFVPHELCTWSAADQLSADQAMQLLQAAVQDGRFPDTVSLVTLQGAKDLSSEQLLQLLERAVQNSSDECTDALCTLPAVEQLSSKAVQGLLLAAVKLDVASWSNVFIIKTLHNLTAASNLSEVHAAQLLDAAVNNSCGPLYGTEEEYAQVLCSTLCGMPAAQKLGRQQALQVLTSAVQRGSVGCVKELCKLPAAKQLFKKEVLQLLWAAEQGGSAQGMAYTAVLRRLPGAR
jgi:hypothetical protein